MPTSGASFQRETHILYRHDALAATVGLPTAAERPPPRAAFYVLTFDSGRADRWLERSSRVVTCPSLQLTGTSDLSKN